MRRVLYPILALVGAVAGGCVDSPVSVDAPLRPGEADLAVRTGEKFSYLSITTPSSRPAAVTVGGSSQMAATLYFDQGGFLSAIPYAQWRSTDPCVATVTSTAPSWGLVRGVGAGTALIIAEAWGKADSILVNVSGSGDLDPGCANRQWAWDPEDVSFTGTPATSYYVRAGEKLTHLVLFAGPKPDYRIGTGESVTLISELWYDGGGKLNGRGFVGFATTDASVATVDPRGKVTGVGPGRAKIIARLGTNFADTVPIFVSGNGESTHPCSDWQWEWDFDDPSFTGTRSSTNTVRAGERLTSLVLFAGPKPDCTIAVDQRVTLRSELRYDGGGTLDGRGYVTFSTTDPSVATISSKGVVTGHAVGRTRVIARLGSNFADTVPLYVR